MHCRKLASLAVATAVFLAALSVRADKQPSVAVLGLEVIDDGSGIDVKTAKLATELSDALRRRATVGAGPFTLAPNSDKELLELKLLGNCSNEARSCMAAIGRDLGADRLMYGKIEKRPEGFQVTIKLLNVETKNMERSTTELIQADDTSPARLTYWSQKLWNRLTGVPDQGNLVIEANVSTAKVFVDNELKGTLNEGTMRIDGIEAGKHVLRVEADGHKAIVSDFMVDPGKTGKAQLNLQPIGMPGGPDTGSGDGGNAAGTWRIAFWGAAAFTGASLAGVTVSGLQVRSIGNNDFERWKAASPPEGISAEDWQKLHEALDSDTVDICAKARGLTQGAILESEYGDIIAACDRGEAAESRQYIFGAATVVGAIVTGFAYYKGYMQPGTSTQRAALGKKRSGAIVDITPTILPNYVGAGVKIEF